MKNTKHGFILKESQELKELKITAHVYEHAKTGAELMHFANDDSNKVFCVTFMTLPEDSTGCPHILEHSVLNGSKNFPAKSTFNELLKGSLHTFINAMTASDMTMYPVASTNATDFMNLMHVYLDAVFYPNIYHEPEIMQQEGWHYELSGKDSELNLRGVVYNEMKGAFSSPDRVVMRMNQQFQFPDTPYGFESGGDPEVIPDLTNDKFLAFHGKYYHPTNSKIFLYGDLDIDAALELIDGQYLSQFEKGEKVAPAPLQKAFNAPKEIVAEYPVDESQDVDNAYYLCLNYTYSNIKAVHDVTALGLLTDLLLNSSAAPLKIKIMASGLAQDAYCSMSSDIIQPTLSIVCKNVHKDNLDKLNDLIQSELKRMVTEGIEKRLIEATISNKEFFLREAQMNYPKGLFYHWGSAGVWIHGGDPLEALRFEPLLQEARRGLTEAYFESYIQKAMLDNPHASKVIYTPHPGMIAAQDAALKTKLAEHKAQLSEAQLDEIIHLSKHLSDYQNANDKPEDIAKIPTLTLEDVDSKADQLPRELDFRADYLLMKHPLPTNGIAYLKAYFDLSHAAEEDLPWLQLYVYFLGEVNSENYSYSQLSMEMDIHTGGIYQSLSMFADYNEPDLIHRCFMLTGKAVSAKIPKLLELMPEYGMKPVFEDQERIKSLLRMYKSRLEGYLMRSGVSVAITRMLKSFSQLHRWKDITEGLEFYHFLTQLESQIETRMPELIRNMETVRNNYFIRRNLRISLTAEPEMMDEIIPLLDSFALSIPDLNPEVVDEHFTSREVNEAITAPVKIQFVAKGGNFFRKGYPYSGKMRVLTNILRNEFLHKEIRVKGGAYGVMTGFSTSGFQYFVSYMDPNLAETLEVYDRVADYLKSFEADKHEMEKFIIGEISSLDYPLNPERKGAVSDEDYITGFTQEDKQQIRTELLSTKVEDIRAFAPMIEELMSKNHYAVFGNDQKIQAAAELFDVITPVFNK